MEGRITALLRTSIATITSYQAPRLEARSLSPPQIILLRGVTGAMKSCPVTAGNGLREENSEEAALGGSEMSGLDQSRDVIMEAAAVVTDLSPAARPVR